MSDGVSVGIGTSDDPPPGFDLLINLTTSVPDFFSRFERVVETTGITDQQREEARERYRFYQQRGYALETHKISELGLQSCAKKRKYTPQLLEFKPNSTLLSLDL